MSRLERLVEQIRPGVVLSALAVHDDEAVLAGGGEVFRLPLAPSGVARQAMLLAALPVLRTRVPVAVAVPRRVGVMPDGETTFTAEPLLPGSPVPPAGLGALAAAQLAGVVAALAGVAPREARAWRVPGDGAVLFAGATLLVDPDRGLLTGVVAWDLRLADGPAAGDLQPAG